MVPDIKKLVTGFLILAAAASSSALVLSNIATTQGSAAALAVTSSTDAATLADDNAFVPSQNDIVDAVVNSDAQTAAALNDPNNLTANFTDAFLNGVAIANPQGLNPDSNGDEVIQSPDPQTVADALEKSPAVKNFKAPDWDNDVAAQKIDVTPSASPSAYSDALNADFNNNLVQGGVEGLVGQQDLDPSNFEAIQSPIQNALSDAVKTPTPAQLATFQKSLVSMLVYEKNMVALAEEAQTDPVKASLVFQAEETKYDAVMQNFNAQSQKASANGLFSWNLKTPKANPEIALLQTYLGLPTANAQWLVFDAAELAQWIEQEVESIILQIVKNTLVAFIQQRVLKWIQGSGAPQFVQQFGNQLVNLAQAKAISSLAGILPGYKASCPNIGNLLGPTTINLGLTAPVKNTPICTLPTVSVQNLGNFYKNFNVSLSAVPGGSWGLYAQILNPGGNYYGALMQTTDYIGQQVSGAQNAQQTKTLANNGLSGQEVCADGSNPNQNGNWCVNVKDSSDIEDVNDDGSCDQGYQRRLLPNDGACPDGSDPKTVTPGQVTKTSLDTALGGGIQLTVNANSIEGVLASVATSLLNTIVQAGISAGVNAATQGLTSVVLSSTAGGPSSVGGVSPASPSLPNLPQLPATTCTPKNPCNPAFDTGSSTACLSGIFGDTIQFTGTGGDGVDYTWSANPPPGIIASPMTASGTQYYVSFSLDPSFGTSTGMTSPLSIPVTVTGSDGVSDTCTATIGQAP